VPAGKVGFPHGSVPMTFVVPALAGHGPPTASSCPSTGAATQVDTRPTLSTIRTGPTAFSNGGSSPPEGSPYESPVDASEFGT